jgi:hypothetical protein
MKSDWKWLPVNSDSGVLHAIVDNGGYMIINPSPIDRATARMISYSKETLLLLKMGLDAGVFEDAPTYEQDVRELLSSIEVVE